MTGLDDFHKSLRSCALDENSLSIVSLKCPAFIAFQFSGICSALQAIIRSPKNVILYYAQLMKMFDL